MMKVDRSFVLGLFAGLFASLILVSVALGVTVFMMAQQKVQAPAKVEEKTPEPSRPKIVQFDSLQGFPSMGPDNAPVTLVEFSDFHCPFCKKIDATLDQVFENYPGVIRRVWRHFPLDMHSRAARAHEASQCAADQNKFWEYHNQLYQNQSDTHTDEALIRHAAAIGINQADFKSCLESGKHKALIQSEIQKGMDAGVRGTPAVFINGELVSGAYPYTHFDQIIKRKLDEAH